MKTNLITKLATPILLAGSLITASPSFANVEENYTPTNLDYSCENSCSDECLFNPTLEKTNFTYEDCVAKENEIIRDGIVSYNEAREWYEMVLKIEYTDLEKRKNPYEKKLGLLNQINKETLRKIDGVLEGNDKNLLSVNDLAIFLLSKEYLLAQGKWEVEEANRIEGRRKEIDNYLSGKKELFKNYLSAVEEWKKNDFVSKREYWSLSPTLAVNDLNPDGAIQWINNTEEIMARTIPINKEFPIRTEFPQIPLLGWQLIGGFFPLFRNLVLKKYLRGSKANEGEYVVSGLAGVINGLVGTLFLDSLHPWVYPFRTLITPLIFQPFFKKTKFFDAEEKKDEK